MPEKPIYIDVDDVLSETAIYFTEVVRRKFRKQVSFEAIHSFDLKESFSLTQGEYDEFFRLVHEPDHILRLQPVVGAVEAVSRWADAGCEICIITGRPPSTRDATFKWLSKHKVPCHSFFMVDKYGRAKGHEESVISMEELAGMEFSIAVEDSSDVARFIATQMDTQVALLDRPWNRAASLNAGIRRYASWREIEAGVRISEE